MAYLDQSFKLCYSCVMARTPDDALRADLLERALDYVCENGLAGLSLRPLAEALDSSSSLLLYHFGSKEELTMAIVHAGRARQQAMMAKLDASDGLSQGDAGRMLWREYSSPRWEPLVRLFFEAYALALQDRSRFPGFLETSVNEWLVPLQASLPNPKSRQARAIATMILSAFRGFLLDLCATRERKRIDEAVDRFCTLLDSDPAVRG
jgi:AcrR family transcriptional regulator